MRYIIIVILILTAFSCKESNDSESKDSEIKIKLKLTTIDLAPSEFKGCGCSLAINEESFIKKEFVYLEKYGMPNDSNNFEVISLNHKTIKRLAYEQHPKFTIHKEYKTSQHIDQEKKLKEGTLTITFNDGEIIKTTFYGSCGC